MYFNILFQFGSLLPEIGSAKFFKIIFLHLKNRNEHKIKNNR